MGYPDSVEFLYALGNEVKSAKFGLEGIRALLEALDNPQHAFRVVHVAGTNGKGSTCALIETGLRSAGWKTGLYTSPHLVEPTERIRIDGEPVTREQFVEAFQRVHETVERLMADGTLEHHTTYFETVTAMGFLLFRDAKIDIAVVEVGLGGRLDATNTVKPELCVITPIDFDHEQFLGTSVESIAAEKAGILKPGATAVFSKQRTEVRQVLETRARDLCLEVVRTEQYRVEHLRLDAYSSQFTANGTLVLCPLAGEHQVENALTATAALQRLGAAPDFGSARWPGRLERICEQPEIILDGAHNPAGARALAAHIQRFYHDREVWIVYGAMRDKSVEEITEILFPLASRVILTAPDQPRALRPQALASEIDHPDVHVAPTAAEALAAARAAGPEVAVFITGSLYLVGEIRRIVG